LISPRHHPAIPGAAEYLCTVESVDVWLVALDRTLPGAAGLLDVAELGRAARFAFERDRGRFVAGRAALRAILAGYVGAAPGALAFSAGSRGKPALPGGLPFSFSHSLDRALCAVGVDREIGVDLEALREVPDAEGIVRSSFTPEEQAAWRAAGGGGGAAFLRLWTRKEAALKALGVGLAGLDAPALAARPTELHDLSLDAGYAAALAIVR
jgi:4'-phosphopantetheinyl transferase